MFTGLVEATGIIKSIVPSGGGLKLAVDISGLKEIPAIGASIAVNGSCLTVTAYSSGIAEFDAVSETVKRTTLKNKKPGDTVNLEPAMVYGGKVDGHFVQGHVDGVGKVLAVNPVGDSIIWTFSLPREIAPLVASKGSIAIDGVSLTVVKAERDSFSVSMIPHTVSVTTFAAYRAGAEVNLEVDVLARYIARKLEIGSGSGVTEELLRENGFI